MATISLKRKITVGTLAILSTCMLVVGLLSLEREGYRLRGDLEGRGAALASVVAEFCITPIRKYSFYIVQEVARNVEQLDGVAFCEIYDARGESLVQVDTTVHGKKLTKKNRVTGDGVMVVERLIEADGARLGRVEIGMELAPVEQELKTHIYGIAFSAMTVLVLVGVAINLFLTRYFISPVVNLSRAVNDLARGDFVETGITRRDDEIGNLARAFDEMSGNLEQLYRDLEKKVDERTADLARANERLQAEVNVRLKAESDLIAAKETAEQANRYKSTFVANMSHEIRTPLNAIIGYTQILQNRAGFNDDDRNALESIDRAGGHLLGLINDILDLSKIEAGRMELRPEPMDLCLLLRNMTGMFQLRCLEKNLSWQVVGIDTAQVVPVIADAGKLRQIFINLLGNAVKFTEQGGVVLRVIRSDLQLFRFCIEDTGPGVPRDSRESIMQPFSNMSGESGKEGTGLGLSISSSFLKLMGSQLEVLENSPQGSRFCFDLRFEAASALSLPPQVPKRLLTGVISKKPVTALIVDDDDLSRALLVQLLKNVKIRTTEARNGVEALRSIEASHPDIVFMDRYMPELGGLETVRVVRERYGDAAPPIVMVTAAAIDSDRKDYQQAGVAGLLLKPCDLSDLLECMVTVLDLEAETSDILPAGEVEPPEKEDQEIIKMVLPDQLRRQLLEALNFGQVSTLKQLAVQLRSDPGVSPAGLAQFSKFLKSYRLDALRQMLE